MFGKACCQQRTVSVDLPGLDEVLGNLAFRVEQLPQLLVDRGLDQWDLHHDHAELAVAVRAVFGLFLLTGSPGPPIDRPWLSGRISRIG